MSDNIYDVIIIGGGPAGLSSVIYARRADMSVLLIEKGILGGQIFQTSEIENYPGGVKGESGAEFCDRMAKQAESFSYEKVTDTVTDVDFDGLVKTIKCQNGEYKAKAVIIATGTEHVTLGVPGEFEYAGRGVSYCATCDAPFFRGLDVFVVGGGDAAVEEALHVAKFARKVTIIHRRDQLRAAKNIQKKAFETENVEFMMDSVIKEIKGGDLLSSIVVENVKTGEFKEIEAKEEDGTFGLFIFVGLKPITEMFEGKVQMENGYIITDENMKTNVNGVYAAGDVRKKSLRQVVTAASDGAIAAVEIEKACLKD
jgi:thioredoxin reductase (NADPH)